MHPRVGEILIQKGIALVYETRDMRAGFDGNYVAKDTVVEPIITESVEPAAESPEPDDGLDGLDAVALHALARERGVKVHARSGAEKVRAALRGAVD